MRYDFSFLERFEKVALAELSVDVGLVDNRRPVTASPNASRFLRNLSSSHQHVRYLLVLVAYDIFGYVKLLVLRVQSLVPPSFCFPSVVLHVDFEGFEVPGPSSFRIFQKNPVQPERRLPGPVSDILRIFLRSIPEILFSE